MFYFCCFVLNGGIFGHNNVPPDGIFPLCESPELLCVSENDTRAPIDIVVSSKSVNLNIWGELSLKCVLLIVGLERLCYQPQKKMKAG